MNPSKSFAPDACGPADSSYVRAANETGGVPLFLQRSEAAKSFQLVREATRQNVSTVLWATGALDGKPEAIRIPVDSTASRITFAFSEDTKGLALELTSPSGKILKNGSEGAEITELNCGRIVTVPTPQTGEWQAQITGRGRYWLRAQAQSGIHLINVEFVKKAGRPGHEGLFRIDGQPIIGMPATLDVSLSAEKVATAEFYLASESGQPIQKLQMNAVNSDPSFLEFVGSVDLPGQPFRVAVEGRDSNGKSYQRFYSNLFRGESVEVSSKFDPEDLSPGSTEKIVFTVRNIAFPHKFRITVVDAHQFVSLVEPKELALGAGESGTVRVEVKVPAGTAPGVGDKVVFVASSIEGPPTSNSSIVRLSVSGGDAEKP